MDVIMSNEKTTVESVPVAPAVRGQATVADSSKPRKDAKVVSLSIDENDDFGGDPYNHTGSHCVLEFDDSQAD
jgi:protein-disulfide isomerase